MTIILCTDYMSAAVTVLNERSFYFGKLNYLLSGLEVILSSQSLLYNHFQEGSVCILLLPQNITLVSLVQYPPYRVQQQFYGCRQSFFQLKKICKMIITKIQPEVSLLEFNHNSTLVLPCLEPTGMKLRMRMVRLWGDTVGKLVTRKYPNQCCNFHCQDTL